MGDGKTYQRTISKTEKDQATINTIDGIEASGTELSDAQRKAREEAKKRIEEAKAKGEGTKALS